METVAARIILWGQWVHFFSWTSYLDKISSYSVKTTNEKNPESSINGYRLAVMQLQVAHCKHHKIKPVCCLTAAGGFSCLIVVLFHFRSRKQLIRWRQFLEFADRSVWEMTRLEASWTGEKTIIRWMACDEAKRVDGEDMFLSRTALLICKAHVNAGSVTCHLRESKSTSRVAFCICWSSSCSVRALVGGSETDRQTFFFYQLAVILFIPLI